ncbi:MAG TPA: DUF4446 family protein [Bacillota bacterium]|nr:DUF4446 family protein [Bacillota bacterium]
MDLDINVWIGVVIGQLIILVIVLVYLLVLGARFRKIRKLFNQLSNGVSEGNMEEVTQQWLDRLGNVEQEFSSIQQQISLLDEAIKLKKGNVGIVRFNAFAHEGSDLSFSVAFLDHSSTGFVLTSIYGREESRVYAKPIENGLSKYHLTEEENEAIKQAKQKVQS